MNLSMTMCSTDKRIAVREREERKAPNMGIRFDSRCKLTEKLITALKQTEISATARFLVKSRWFGRSFLAMNNNTNPAICNTSTTTYAAINPWYAVTYLDILAAVAVPNFSSKLILKMS